MKTLSKLSSEEEQLMEVMLYHLAAFNKKGIPLSVQTVHAKVLQPNDGLTESTSSKMIYKGLIRWTLQANGLPDKPWPRNWMQQSVQTLAKALV